MQLYTHTSHRPPEARRDEQQRGVDQGAPEVRPMLIVK